MKFSKDQNDRSEREFSFDIDIQENEDFQINTSSDDYVRSRYKGSEPFSYFKFFIGLFLVSLSVFAIIKMYNRYEEIKEAEAIKKEIEEWSRIQERDFQNAMNMIENSVPSTKPAPTYKYVDELYQAPDGTWKNRKRQVKVSKDVKAVAEEWAAEDRKRMEKIRQESDFQIEEMHNRMREEQRKEYERTHISDLSSYERFDDPRDKKK